MNQYPMGPVQEPLAKVKMISLHPQSRRTMKPNLELSRYLKQLSCRTIQTRHMSQMAEVSYYYSQNQMVNDRRHQHMDSR